ncbi:hypothetical protein H0H93_013726 [Arthromyces matolae]|nr:hypothetical protein H0H93_013726 [Arthromyces matolae]
MGGLPSRFMVSCVLCHLVGLRGLAVHQPREHRSNKSFQSPGNRHGIHIQYRNNNVTCHQLGRNNVHLVDTKRPPKNHTEESRVAKTEALQHLAYCCPLCRNRSFIWHSSAEEGGGGKIKLLNEGAYKDMDVCLMSHPGPGPVNSSGDGPMTASQTMYVTFKGKSAHAAASPWEGINALDAAVSVHNSVSSLRQQLKPELRVHGIIEGTDWAPNVIPDNAKLTYMARAPTQKDLADLVERLRNCFLAAALATGCEVSIQMKDAYLDLRQNPVLATPFYAPYTGKEYGKMSVEHCDMIFHHGGSSGSTDFGNVSYELPSLHPLYSE